MRPIDADRALEIVRDQGIAHPNAYHLTNYATLILREAPTIDVAPVNHGQWVQVICHEEFEDGFVDRVKECCSVCHAPNWQRTTNCCPNCGAKMDGGRIMKQDMSKTCGFGYQAMWVKRDNGEISEKEFIQWYDEHCANCLYMNEICMLGEVE